MIKFVYPLSAAVGYRKSAWREFDRFCNAAGVVPQWMKLREETIMLDSVLIDSTTNEPFKDRRRLYTVSFSLDDKPAARLMSMLSSTRHRLYRQLTPQSVLILADDRLQLDER